MAANPPSGSDAKLIAGRYQLGEMVGRGGMGGVWMAEDLKLNRRVAVKLLSRDVSADPEIKERFEAEARAAARLNHPNVVGVYDTGDHKGVPFIVMELLSGKTLADELKEGPLDPGRVLRIAAQALAGLDAAHKAGIVHRDVKPGNILFTAGEEQDTVKVADFGIAKGTQRVDLTQTGMMVGTPAYLSPEQVIGQPVTPASDIYSLGVVMYEALTGRQPFQAETVVALANMIHNSDPTSLLEARPGMDPQIAAIVEKAMAKNPPDRFASAAEMAEAVAEVVHSTSDPVARTGERTVVAPSPRAAASDRTEVLTAPATSGRTEAQVVPQRGLSRPVRLAIALSVLALVLIIGVVAWQSLNQSLPTSPARSPTPAITGGSPLPSPLETSLDRLEEAIRP